MAENRTHAVSYDPAADVLTFDGFRFSGELMRQFTETPCGTMFRIVSRDGSNRTLTVSSERDPLAAVAPELLAALQMQETAELDRPMDCEECGGEGEPEACGACFPPFDDARIARRAAIVRATELGGASSTTEGRSS